MTNSDRIQLATREAVNADLENMASAILERLPQPDDVILVGIHGKGVLIATALTPLLESRWGAKVTTGTLDVGMHRDDLDQNPVPTLQPTNLPASITGKSIILVEDVIQSGRTIRAALDALHDFGRPDQVLLAVLIDRGGRRLPLTPDIVGRRVELEPDKRIRLSSLPDQFGLEVNVEPS